MRIIIIPSLFSLLLLLGCTKEEFAGSEIINSTNREVEAIEILLNSESVDFYKGESLYLKGDLTTNRTVNVTLTGLTSGAEKAYSLNASELNKQNTNWLGGSTNLIGFQKEDVQIRISFYGTEQTITDTFEITGLQNFQFDNMLNSQFNGFEEELIWPFFLANAEAIQPINAPQGQFVLKAEYQVPYTYIAEENVSNPEEYFNLPRSSEDVYFNIYVYGNSDAESTFFIEFKEADGDHTTSENGKDDGVQFLIPLNFSGWKLFSMRYDKMPFSTVEAFGGNGNKIHEPHKIKTITYNVEAKTSNSFYIDFPIFTIGAPFNPENY